MKKIYIPLLTLIICTLSNISFCLSHIPSSYNPQTEFFLAQSSIDHHEQISTVTFQAFYPDGTKENIKPCLQERDLFKCWLPYDKQMMGAEVNLSFTTNDNPRLIKECKFVYSNYGPYKIGSICLNNFHYKVVPQVHNRNIVFYISNIANKGEHEHPDHLPKRLTSWTSLESIPAAESYGFWNHLSFLANPNQYYSLEYHMFMIENTPEFSIERASFTAILKDGKHSKAMDCIHESSFACSYFDENEPKRMVGAIVSITFSDTNSGQRELTCTIPILAIKNEGIVGSICKDIPKYQIYTDGVYLKLTYTSHHGMRSSNHSSSSSSSSSDVNHYNHSKIDNSLANENFDPNTQNKKRYFIIDNHIDKDKPIEIIQAKFLPYILNNEKTQELQCKEYQNFFVCKSQQDMLGANVIIEFKINNQIHTCRFINNKLSKIDIGSICLNNERFKTVGEIINIGSKEHPNYINGLSLWSINDTGELSSERKYISYKTIDKKSNFLENDLLSPRKWYSTAFHQIIIKTNVINNKDSRIYLSPEVYYTPYYAHGSKTEINKQCENGDKLDEIICNNPKSMIGAHLLVHLVSRNKSPDEDGYNRTFRVGGIENNYDPTFLINHPDVLQCRIPLSGLSLGRGLSAKIISPCIKDNLIYKDYKAQITYEESRILVQILYDKYNHDGIDKSTSSSADAH